MCASHKSSEVFYISSQLSYGARTVYHKVQQRLQCPDPAHCALGHQTPPSGIEGIFFALAVCQQVSESNQIKSNRSTPYMGAP